MFPRPERGEHIPRILGFLLLSAWLLGGSYAEDIETVRSRLEMCADRLDRTEYELERVERTLEDLRDLDNGSVSGNQETGTFENLSNRTGLLTRRVSRARTQHRRILDRIRDIKGSCPDCVRSDVDLFCRQAEGVHSESGELLDRLRELMGTARSKKAAEKTLAQANHLLTQAEALAATADQSPRADSGRAAATRARNSCDRATQAMTSGKIDRAADWAFRCSHNASDAVQLLSRTGRPEEGRWARLESIRRELSVPVQRADEKTQKLFSVAQQHLQEAHVLIKDQKPEQAKAELRIAEALLSRIRKKLD